MSNTAIYKPHHFTPKGPNDAEILTNFDNISQTFFALNKKIVANQNQKVVNSSSFIGTLIPAWSAALVPYFICAVVSLNNEIYISNIDSNSANPSSDHFTFDPTVTYNPGASSWTRYPNGTNYNSFSLWLTRIARVMSGAGP